MESRLFPGTHVVFFPFGTALEYHDVALHKTLEIAIPEHAKLRWVRYRDQRTRDEMAQLINEGMPGGEAIVKAMEKHKHLWDMEDKTIAAETSTSLRIVDGDGRRSPSRTPRDRHARKGKGGGKAGDLPSLSGVRLGQRDSNKRQICGAYNSRRGCTKKEGVSPRGRGTPATSSLQTAEYAKAGTETRTIAPSAALMWSSRDSALRPRGRDQCR